MYAQSILRQKIVKHRLLFTTGPVAVETIRITARGDRKFVPDKHRRRAAGGGGNTTI